MTGLQVAAFGVIALGVALVMLGIQVRALRERLSGLVMELECVRRKLGVTDEEGPRVPLRSSTRGVRLSARTNARVTRIRCRPGGES